jgi:hypothetical protein
MFHPRLSTTRHRRTGTSTESPAILERPVPASTAAPRRVRGRAAGSRGVRAGGGDGDSVVAL